MKSLLEALGAQGKSTSIREIAKQHDLPEPISVRELSNELAPRKKQYKINDFEAGDVRFYSAYVAFFSNGIWALSGTLHDKGVFYGDKYVLVVVPRFEGDANGTPGIKDEGTIGHKDDRYIELAGRHPWVKEHFDAIYGYNAVLHADPNLSLGFQEILSGIIGGAIIGLTIAFFLTPGEIEVRRIPPEEGGGLEWTKP